jgi:hypothetical protein
MTDLPWREAFGRAVRRAGAKAPSCAASASSRRRPREPAVAEVSPLPAGPDAKVASLNTPVIGIAAGQVFTMMARLSGAKFKGPAKEIDAPVVLRVRDALWSDIVEATAAACGLIATIGGTSSRWSRPGSSRPASGQRERARSARIRSRLVPWTTGSSEQADRLSTSAGEVEAAAETDRARAAVAWQAESQHFVRKALRLAVSGMSKAMKRPLPRTLVIRPPLSAARPSSRFRK